jgi:D-alanyl-D-alanine carboxypeptidase/D-alanyl-D-alanine-endopeptidase (penicillin-binding protein 4)
VPDRCVPALRRALVLTALVLALASAADAGGKKKPARPRTAPSVPQDLAGKLSTLLARQPKATQIGLVALDPDGRTTLFEHEPNTPLKPASVLKLLTTAAALDRFGPDFQYETRVYLQGDELYVIGAGDPSLGDERLAERLHRERDVFAQWAAQLKARGVTRLSRIVLDDSIFDTQAQCPDWPAAQSDRWYQAPVGGLNINDNCLDAEFVVRGTDVQLQLNPALPASMVSNRVSLGKTRALVAKRPPHSDRFEFSGTVNGNWQLDSIAARDPLIFFAQALHHTLARAGVPVADDPIRRTLHPADLSAATVIANPSTPLADVLWRANTFSQNLFAECLAKSLAAYQPDGHRSGAPGSWSASREIVRQTLTQFGIDLAGLRLRDGSGLSHQNRATATQLARLLVAMRHHRHAQLFADTLAVPGEPGSMEHRYTELRGRLRGKTGTLVGVHALAGYLTRSDGRTVVFALLINGGCTNTFPVDVCRTLLESPLP